MALARAMLKYIHDDIGAFTLFSTHYHELTALDQELSGLENVHVKATEYNGQLVFLHKVKPGAVEKSYGIHVARLADLPQAVTDMAADYLSGYEEGNHQKSSQFETMQLELPLDDQEASSFEERQIIDEIKNINLNDLTPLEALNRLADLQKRMD